MQVLCLLLFLDFSWIGFGFDGERRGAECHAAMPMLQHAKMAESRKEQRKGRQTTSTGKKNKIKEKQASKFYKPVPVPKTVPNSVTVACIQAKIHIMSHQAQGERGLVCSKCTEHPPFRI